MYCSTFEMEQIRNGSDLTNTQIRQKQVTMNDLSVLPFRLRKYHILRILFVYCNGLLCKKNNKQSTKMSIIANLN